MVTMHFQFDIANYKTSNRPKDQYYLLHQLNFFVFPAAYAAFFLLSFFSSLVLSDVFQMNSLF